MEVVAADDDDRAQEREREPVGVCATTDSRPCLLMSIIYFLFFSLSLSTFYILFFLFLSPLFPLSCCCCNPPTLICSTLSALRCDESRCTTYICVLGVRVSSFPLFHFYTSLLSTSICSICFSLLICHSF